MPTMAEAAVGFQRRLAESGQSPKRWVRPPAVRDFYIYIITCDKTGFAYVGMTSRPNNRIVDHYAALSLGTHPCKRMQAHWCRHGAEAFEWAIMDRAVSTRAEASDRERCWMRYLFSTHGGNWAPYNSPKYWLGTATSSWRGPWRSAWLGPDFGGERTAA